MPYALGAIQVQAGKSYTVPVGSAGTVGAVVCANESPYAVNASISATGAPGQWIVAQTADLIACDVSGFNGSLTFTTDNYLSNSASAPSFLLYLTAFAPGEAIRGTYPAPLMRLASGSIGVATQLVNDGNSVGTNIIESTPGGAVNSYVLVRNDGTFQIWAISNNVLTEIIGAAPGGTSTPASLNLAQVHITGAVSLDGGEITTNGTGELDVTSAGSRTALYLLSGGSTDQWQTIGVKNVSGSTAGAMQFATATSPSTFIFPFAIVGANTIFVPPTILSWIDAAGMLHASAPVTLTAGNQETGPAGFRGGVNTAGDFFGGMVNFKTVMTNTPTSITLAITISTQNVAGVASATQITKNGFLLQWATSTASNTFWLGSYTTVGNCLLAVDPVAHTLDHHCDACGHVSIAAPFSAITHDVQFNEPVMSYGCPTCGAVECFNTLLTSADEADTTPQGAGDYQTTRGAQATLIRQLMTALGLEVAP